MFHWRSRGCRTKLLLLPAVTFLLYSVWSATEDEYVMESDLIIQRHINGSSQHKQQKDTGTRICTQKERRDHVTAMCRNLTTKYMDYSKSICFKAVNPEMAGQGPCLLIDHQHKVAFCEVTKSGSSTGIALMMNYGPRGGKAPITPPAGVVHSPEMKLKMGLVQEIYTPKLDNYTKFMIVRHPFDRLLSSYFDKLQIVDTTARFKLLRLSIGLKYGNLSWKDIDGPLDAIPDVNVTFGQFIDMLTDTRSRQQVNDEHWDTTALLCDPCRVQYDYIMRTESLHHDATEFIRNVYHRKDLMIPKENVNRDIVTPMEGRIYNKLLRKQYDSVAKRDLDLLVKRHKTDLDLYGYDFNTDTLQAHCSIDTEDNSCC